MRPAERNRKIWPFFLCNGGQKMLCNGTQRGGCSALKSRNAAKPLSSMSLILLWLSTVHQLGSLRPRAACGERRERPPPKQGGYVT